MHAKSLRGVWVVGLGVFVVVLAAATVARAAPNKPYSVVLTADVAANGSTVTGTFVNETSHQRLGSANLTAPAGYTLSSATVSQGSATVVGNVVELRNLALMPGQSLTVTIQVTSTACSNSTWRVEAKQANNFSGPPGNDLTLNTAKSNLNTAVCAAPCPSNATCNTDAGNANGDAQVAASASSNAGELFESANASNLTPLTCENPDGSDYVSADPNVYGVLAPEDRAKVVTITITNPVVTIALKDQQVCFEAPYQFTTVTGAQANIGLLPTCGPDNDAAPPTSGPCLDRDDDSENPSTGTVVLVVNIPSGLPGDPHMN